MKKGWPVVGALVVLAVVFVILAGLYATGAINFLATSAHKNHYSHAFVMVGLAVLCLVAASFARPVSGGPSQVGE